MVSFWNTQYHLPPWSISILPDCKSVAFNTAEVRNIQNHLTYVILDDNILMRWMFTGWGSKFEYSDDASYFIWVAIIQRRNCYSLCSGYNNHEWVSGASSSHLGYNRLSVVHDRVRTNTHFVEHFVENC